MTLRPAIPADTAFLQRLFASTRDGADMLPEQLIAMQYGSQRGTYRARFPEASYSIIEHEGQAVGELVLDRGDEIRVVNIAFLPEYRGQGLGTKIICQLQEEARQQGKPITLSVAKSNPAKGLYERLGFTTTGESGAYETMEWRP